MIPSNSPGASERGAMTLQWWNSVPLLHLRRWVSVLVAMPANVVVALLCVYGVMVVVAQGYAILGRVVEPRLAWLLTVWLLGPLVSLWICIPVVRMALRVFPVRTDSRRRLGCVTGLVAIALLYGGIFAVGITTTSARSDEEQSSAVMFGAMGLLLAVTSLVLASTYLRARRALQGPFVLFLRRCSTFSDRVVIGLILRVVPRHMRVILLASPTGGPVIGIPSSSPSVACPCSALGATCRSSRHPTRNDGQPTSSGSSRARLSSSWM